ncbi:MAG: V-type ATPase 116kDa subunit family protein [Treponema sp.]|nr:ATPase [Spirochaetia bacterium]MDD7533296.1 V-type ATPase 116kDa subunit family protein [Treponema sp.]MDY3721797.1 V-type ATPase 116kDa subunit family protein [Treponema sp.]MDY5758676.1 V-type ATPase 116kDa subunit family protein [Treponema sp.]MDY5816595.1 V-type ATPase 116kDa subunit family protein [Treponema sp.]
MAKTAEMKLLELMVLKNDISAVIEYIGKKENFQFQSKLKDSVANDAEGEESLNIDSHFYDSLSKAYTELGYDSSLAGIKDCSAPCDDDRKKAADIIAAYTDLKTRIADATDEAHKVNEAYKEAMAFSNLKVSYSELEHLSFLSLRIGRIPENQYEDLKYRLEGSAVVIKLGNDSSHILVASSKKGRFALDAELKNHNFVELEVPAEFKGVPESALKGLEQKKAEADKNLEELITEKSNFAETHQAQIEKLLGSFTIAVQIEDVTRRLESTELVYRITGWIPASETENYMKGLDELTEGRIAIRAYEPFEVPSVMSGKEQVPVKLKHGKFVKSFERMIFSYGSPVYGAIDPTPFVAVFFTILFGIMFGDFGQGLFFVLFGILMLCNVIKVGGWNKFAPIFMAIGISSSIMGLLTGEFFGTETVLEPFAEWVTGLFGTPRAPILKLMPSADPKSIYVMFGVFGVAVAIGFVINTCGLVLNIINNLGRKRYAEALLGKNGLAGAVFFWYVIALVLRIVLAKHAVAAYDVIIILVSLFFAAFAEPFERALNHEKPLFENGFGTYVISGAVELIEVVSGYLSNTVSFVRVGAFALSHAVLNFTILTLTEMVGGPRSIGGIIVLIAGNALIIVLEGMIVAIQVIRLQYYEFFSKFFHETGKEFKPFRFELK